MKSAWRFVRRHWLGILATWAWLGVGHFTAHSIIRWDAEGMHGMINHVGLILTCALAVSLTAAAIVIAGVRKIMREMPALHNAYTAGVDHGRRPLRIVGGADIIPIPVPRPRDIPVHHADN